MTKATALLTTWHKDTETTVLSDMILIRWVKQFYDNMTDKNVNFHYLQDLEFIYQWEILFFYLPMRNTICRQEDL